MKTSSFAVTNPSRGAGNMHRFLFGLVILALTIAGPAYAAHVYYLSPSFNNGYTVNGHPYGSDSADGGPSTPWATLQKAASTMVAGDTLICYGGKYTDTQYFQTRVGNIAIKNYINLTTRVYETPWFTGPLLSSGDGWSYGGDGRFDITSSCPYVYIRGIRSTGGNVTADGARQVSLRGQNATFYRCRFDGNKANTLENSSGFLYVFYALNASYWTMDQCTVQYSNGVPSPRQNDGACMEINGDCHHFVVQNSVIRYGAHDGIKFWHGLTSNYPSYAIFRRNIIDNAGETDPERAAYNGESYGGGYGFDWECNRPGIEKDQYMVIEDNRIHAGWASYMEKCPLYMAGARNVTIRKNIIWNSYANAILLESQYAGSINRNNFIYNNTIIRTGGAAIAVNMPSLSPDTHMHDNLIANNLLYDAWENQEASRVNWGDLAHFHLISIYLLYPWTCWSSPTDWANNRFRNNVMRELKGGYPTVLDLETTCTGSSTHTLASAAWPDSSAGFPMVFKGNVYYDDTTHTKLVKPRLQDSVWATSNKFDDIKVTLKPNSPCIDRGINMNRYDTVVSRILGGSDAAWARAAGLDTLKWYGRAPDIGSYEANSGNPMNPVPVDIHRLNPPR